MSRDIVVNVQRVNGTQPAVKNVPLQLDNLPVPAEVLYYEGVTHVEHFEVYVLGIYDIRQTDILTETNTSTVDPQTGTAYRYRVISISEPFPDNHMEATISLLRGGM